MTEEEDPAIAVDDAPVEYETEEDESMLEDETPEEDEGETEEDETALSEEQEDPEIETVESEEADRKNSSFFFSSSFNHYFSFEPWLPGPLVYFCPLVHILASLRTVLLDRIGANRQTSEFKFRFLVNFPCHAGLKYGFISRENVERSAS